MSVLDKLRGRRSGDVVSPSVPAQDFAEAQVQVPVEMTRWWPDGELRWPQWFWVKLVGENCPGPLRILADWDGSRWEAKRAFDVGPGTSVQGWEVYDAWDVLFAGGKLAHENFTYFGTYTVTISLDGWDPGFGSTGSGTG